MSNASSPSAQEAKHPQGESRPTVGDCEHGPLLGTFGRILKRLDEVAADQRKIEARLTAIEAKQEMKKFKGKDEGVK